MKDLLWKKTERCDWQEVARRLKIEEDAIDYHNRNPGSPMPNTPWIDDVRKVATRKGLNVDQTIFEIKGYANRNAAGHTGIGKMIDECDWQTLAERIEYDKATLNMVFANEPSKGVMMRVAIGRVANTWFKKIDWRMGYVAYEFSERALRKEKALERRRESRALNVPKQPSSPYRWSEGTCCGEA